MPATSGPHPCAGKWELFDATDATRAAEARRLCVGCEIRTACGGTALSLMSREVDAHPEGTWAGVTYVRVTDATGRRRTTRVGEVVDRGTLGDWLDQVLAERFPAADVVAAEAAEARRRQALAGWRPLTSTELAKNGARKSPQTA